jgi:hypothetical protein
MERYRELLGSMRSALVVSPMLFLGFKPPRRIASRLRLGWLDISTDAKIRPGLRIRTPKLSVRDGARVGWFVTLESAGPVIVQSGAVVKSFSRLSPDTQVEIDGRSDAITLTQTTLFAGDAECNRRGIDPL